KPAASSARAATGSPSGSAAAAGQSASAGTFAAPAAAPPAVATLRGRAVHYLDLATPGPKLGIGTRSDSARLRIGIDDERSTVEIDRPKRRITFHNEASYDEEQIVGDVVLPGWTESAAGRAPASVHAVFRKKKDKVTTAVYAHVVTREKVSKV